MLKKVKPLFLIAISALFSLWGVGGFAQLYPVQLTPIFNPPYSVRLSDYATSMDTKFRLLINPTDITMNRRQVALKLIIQGRGLNIQSVDYFYLQGQSPVYITGGELQTLTNIDLAALFRLENLQGISASQYANPLPEGMYDVCFELYDVMINKKLSQKSCATMYLQLNDPPLLNLPVKNEQIMAADFPNILFSWTPRQINATNVSYTFELKEILDPNLDPQYAFLMSPILYQETDRRSTALLYNLAMPTLIPGKRYAWRVKATSMGGLSENSVFKNNGYSEIYYFKYATNCFVPAFLLSEAQSPKTVKISWQFRAEHLKYHVQYRTKGRARAEWFSVYTQNTQTTLTDLEPGATYEFRVGATCEQPQYGVEESYLYSTIQEFTMPDKKSDDKGYNCGIQPTLNLSNQTPLTNMIVGETFTAGDYPVKVLELKNQNPYTGKGYIVVPYLADTKIAVEFTNITINTDYKLIQGVVETGYNPIGENLADIDEQLHDIAGLIDEIKALIDSILEESNELRNQGLLSEEELQELIITANEQQTIIDNANQALENLDSDATDSKSKIDALQQIIVQAQQELDTIENELKAKSKTSIKFVTFDKDFENREILATLYTNKDLLIKIVKTDTISKADLGKLKYLLGKKELAITQRDKDYFVSLKADKATLAEGKNELRILDGDKELSKLFIATYYPPTIEFDRGDNFNGEYLFDKGFEQPALKSGYTTFKTGKQQEDYFTPVFGLNKNIEVLLKGKVKNLDDLAEKDPLFKVIIKPAIENKIEINKGKLELDFITLKNLKNLSFKSLYSINGKELTPMMIEFYIKSNNERIGALEYYCAEKTNKTIRLIYTKFLDESTYPNYFTKQSLENYLNTNSMNQLFLNMIVEEERYTANFKSDVLSKASTTEIFGKLLKEKFDIGLKEIPSDYNPEKAKDYYFVTDLVRELSGGSKLGGAHWAGRSGGFHVKIDDLGGEKVESLAAHEFGHWVNFPHTFESNEHVNVTVNPTLGGTQENFMDYNITRLSWYKLQLLNSDRTE